MDALPPDPPAEVAPVTNPYKTAPADCVIAPSGWVPWNGGRITAEPLIDSRTGLYARLDHVDARTATRRFGGRLLTEAEERKLHTQPGATLLEPVMLWKEGRDITERQWAEEHDRQLRAQLVALRWDGKTPLANDGKHWVEDGEPGTLIGWYLPKQKRFVQTASPAGMDGNPDTKPFHAGGRHADYSSLVHVFVPGDAVTTSPAAASPPPTPVTHRATIRKGSVGADVLALQAILHHPRSGIEATCSINSIFDAPTDRDVRAFQAVHGLTVDGIVGPKTWAKCDGVVDEVPDTDPNIQPTEPIEFIQAKNYTAGRIKPIDLIVIHTMEAAEKPGTARAVAVWFASKAAPMASAHYCLDASNTIQCVHDGDTAFHAPGANANGLGVEHAGYASQTEANWNDDYSTKLLARSAALVALLCKRHGIPCARVYVDGLKRGERGITTHADVSLAFRKSTHTDPGPRFPMGRYLDMVAHELAKLG